MMLDAAHWRRVIVTSVMVSHINSDGKQSDCAVMQPTDQEIYKETQP